MNDKLYTKLTRLRAYQKTALPFLQTAVDLDILLEVGRAQESGRTLGTTDLFFANFAPAATISRRLRRLKEAGAITERCSSIDARRVELQVSPAVSRRLRRLAGMSS